MRKHFILTIATGIFLFSPIKNFSQSTFIDQDLGTNHYLQRFEILSGKISDQLHFSSLPYQRKKAVLFLDSLRAQGSAKSAVEDTSIQNLNDQGVYAVDPFGSLWFGSLSGFSVIDGESVDYLLTDNDEWSEYKGAKSKKPFLKVFYRDKASLYQHRDNNFLVKINPVFDFEIGKESASDETLFTNTRGIEVKGWIAKRVGYDFYLTENQARYPLFVRERIDSFGAVINEGYYKEFKTDGVDFFDAKGYFDFTAAKFITIQFGHGKNFLGNGIRSLALSGFSEDYLFLKLQTQIWKIHYQNLFMDMTSNFLRGGDQLLPKKFAAIHQLSINATKWLNVGVFESVVFHRDDGFELQYLNPIIFYRSIEQLIGSPDNTALGIDYRANFLRHFSYYGQVMLDDYNFGASKGQKGYWGNKYGIQQGIKYVNAFTVNNLDLQLEWNYVRPYTYTHSDSVANYSNYNQPLAHPLGANFSEFMGVIRYQPIFPLTIEAIFLYASQGRDTSNSNWGGNIFIPTTENTIERIYGNEVAQGVKNQLTNFQFSVSYMIRHNLFADATGIFRKTSSDFTAFNSSSTILQVGLRMNIARKSFAF